MSIVDKISTRQEFIEFVSELHQDFLDHKQDWENQTLETFLEALTRYAMDIQGYYNNTEHDINANVASWQVFADMLIGAKVYE